MECLFVGVCINQMLFHMYIWYNNSKKVEGSYDRKNIGIYFGMLQ